MRAREAEMRERETDETGGQADGWKPHPGLLPPCLLSSVIRRRGGSQVLFHLDMGGEDDCFYLLRRNL